jgi:hypothetical protein
MSLSPGLAMSMFFSADKACLKQAESLALA